MIEETISHNGLRCIEIENPTEEVRNFLRESVLENRIAEPVYIARSLAGAFLQADYDTYILIEFWGTRPEPFIDWLNENFKGEIKCLD